MPDDPRWLGDSPDRDAALLAFFLGPVQPFIAGARTVRDLWTGSYLLAWLTFAAITKILETPGARLVSPDLPEGHPLRWTVRKQGPRPDGVTTPSIPNRFIARISREVDAHDLARKCERACRDRWREVCQKVRDRISGRLDASRAQFRVSMNGHTVDLLATPWDRLWDGPPQAMSQVQSFFEVRSAVLFPGRLTEERLQELLDPIPDRDRAAMDVLFGLMDARKSVRHVPDYRAEGDVPQKCTLLGTYEQMGPAPLDESRAFWEAFAKHVDMEGTHVREGERLCAISLVKRFAWPAYLREALGVQDVRELHYSDTATVAAKRWLRPDATARARGLDFRAIRRSQRDWSGQWIHWTKPDQDKVDPCPERIWEQIEPVLAEKRRRQGNPPTYYAILMADADKLGDKLASRAAQVSAALTGFALRAVRDIIQGEEHSGELIYSGGDDTLALLPTETAVACARAVARRYADNWGKHFPREEVATISAGLAVVHHKEDLRFALDVAREAEHAAKHFGRDALAITVCRRSGEHTSAVLGWEQADDLDELVQSFRAGISDRWTYKLRALLPTFEKMPWDSFTAELRRLLGRIEGVTIEDRATFGAQVMAFAGKYLREHQRRQPAEQPLESFGRVMTGFVTLCQSASFLARGKDA